ncbi:MAG: peptidylprolyl isomerase [Elainellaceae cyanobacterium]
MSVMLKIGNRTVSADDIVPLMAQYQMLPQFLQEVLIDEAIADIECSEEEKQKASEAFFQQHQLTTPEAQQAWLKHYRMTPTQLQDRTTRELRIEKFKVAKWGPKLESYFLDRKSRLDRVIYSLIRTRDLGIAQELYFRISEGEQTFGETAREYSQGPEAQTEGLIGPVELSVPHPVLGQMLSVSQPGQLCPPTRVGEWVVIVRLERFIPAQMDDAMRQRLLNECFQEWIKEQLNRSDSQSLNHEIEEAAPDASPSSSDPEGADSKPEAVVSEDSSAAEKSGSDEAASSPVSPSPP